MDEGPAEACHMENSLDVLEALKSSLLEVVHGTFQKCFEQLHDH
jgi:hypothetical protein